MTTTTTDPIIRIIDGDAFHALVNSYGGNYLRRVPAAPEDTRWGVGYLRHHANAFRNLDDPDFPDRPVKMANALDVMAGELERRPVEDSDWLRMTEDDRDLFGAWARYCQSRSPLLEPVAHELGELAGSQDPRVGQARRVLELLVDANLLLPGIDAALRSVLEPYAATRDGDELDRCGDLSCPCNGGTADTGAARHVHVCPPDTWCGCE